MLGRVSERLLALLQLTRMALVFTAVSNALASLALRHDDRGDVPPTLVIATLAVAVGLYGFGMALNDIIDRRRDQQLQVARPLPSGRIGIWSAIVVAGLMLVVATAGGWLFLKTNVDAAMASAVLLAVTVLLIATYDAAGKYLVWVGLLLLGLVRFFHAAIPAPHLPVVWHPLFLLNHVAIISAVAYRSEAKRPPLDGRQVAYLALGLAALNLGLIFTLFYRRGLGFAESLRIEPALLLPTAAAIVFALLGRSVRRKANDRRAAGKALILYGLLWLIVYDALFVIGYVDVWWGLSLLILWPTSFLAVKAMRVWANMTDVARRPEYVRADSRLSGPASSR
ncbi:MAG: UbiA family prenyltransferase [Planctomycetota bacterium]